MQYFTVSTRADLEALLADESTHAQAHAYLQALMDEQYGYDATGAWVLVGGGGLERLGITRAEAVAMGAVEQAVAEPARSGPTLEQAQTMKIAEAAQACDSALAPYAARFSVLERLTWDKQLTEAKAILTDPSLAASAYPTISGIIAVTGETAANFAAAVVKNNDDWTALAARAAGLRQKAVTEIKALGTVSAVEAYTVSIVL